MRSVFVERVGDPILTLDEVKDHLVVEHSDDDVLIQHYMDAAVRYCENHTRRSMQVTRRKCALDDFPSCIEIPNPPMRSLENIKYINTEGVQVTLSSTAFEIDHFSEWGRLVPVESWPSVKPGINRVIVEYLTGYGRYTVPGRPPGGYPMTYGEAYGTSAPEVKLSEDESSLRQAMYLMVGHWYENREAEVVGTISKQLALGVDRILSHFVVIQAA